MPTYKGHWYAKVKQSFEIDAEDDEEFETLVEREMDLRNAVEGTDWHYDLEDVE
jgi:hypothetical protein